MKRIFVLFFAVGFFIQPSFAQPSSDKILGRAGNTYITEQEFQQRFEFLPALYRHRKSQLEAAKVELMYSMIAEKLLAEEARQRNLEQDSAFLSSTLEVRKLLARDQLYREAISQKVVLSPKEITAGSKAALKQILCSFIYLDKEADAAFVRAQIRRPEDFETLAIDSTMPFFRDTATIVWGDAKQSVEDAAYKLRVGEVSPVIRAGDGYYILKCLSIASNTFYTSLPPQTLRERVVGQLRQRKEKELMLEYLKDAFKDKIGYTRPEAFKQLATAMMDAFAGEAKGTDSILTMTKDVAAQVRATCRTMLRDTLTVAGSTTWTVDDMIGRLVNKRWGIRREDVKRIPGKLNGDIGFWVQQELLGQEAVRLGLDQRPEVKKNLEIWEASSLAGIMKRNLQQRLSITDEEFWKYLAYVDSTKAVPQVQLRELRTSSLDDMRQALAELQRGERFENVILKWSNDPQAKKAKGITPMIPITDRAPLGTFAAKMKVGERYGPIRIADSVFFFEVVAKKDLPSNSDTSFVAKKAKAEQDLFLMKYKRTLNLFLAQIGDRRGFEIYGDRLKQVEVTPIPMMTFRMLGFGGRMFEVPFVDPQLEWIDIDPPKETILP